MMDTAGDKRKLTERILIPANSWKGIKSQVFILEGTVDFILKWSASRVALQAVADDLEISKGAVQAHFKNSDILMASTLFYVLKTNMEDLIAVLDASDGSFARALYDIIERQADWATSKYNIAQLDIRYCARSNPTLETLIKQVLESTQKMSHSTLVRGMNLDGEFYKKYLIFREALVLSQNSLGTHSVLFRADMPSLGVRSIEDAKTASISELKRLHGQLWGAVETS